MKFWDRGKERSDLRVYIKSELNSILFVYGPKSSGKSTLLRKVMSDLKNEKDFPFLEKYHIYWFDLRGKFISNYENVVEIFFLEEDAEASKEIAKEFEAGISRFIKVKRAVKEDIEKRRVDAFSYMESVLRKENKKSVIVFDEL